LISGQDSGSWYHQHFVRDDSSQLKLVKRTAVKGNSKLFAGGIRQQEGEQEQTAPSNANMNFLASYQPDIQMPRSVQACLELSLLQAKQNQVQVMMPKTSFVPPFTEGDVVSMGLFTGEMRQQEQTAPSNANMNFLASYQPDIQVSRSAQACLELSLLQANQNQVHNLLDGVFPMPAYSASSAMKNIAQNNPLEGYHPHLVANTQVGYTLHDQNTLQAVETAHTACFKDEVHSLELDHPYHVSHEHGEVLHKQNIPQEEVQVKQAPAFNEDPQETQNSDDVTDADVEGFVSTFFPELFELE
jgi:hypothetical protein